MISKPTLDVSFNLGHLKKVFYLQDSYSELGGAGEIQLVDKR
jgi:hypothetical protein